MHQLQESVARFVGMLPHTSTPQVPPPRAPQAHTRTPQVPPPRMPQVPPPRAPQEHRHIPDPEHEQYGSTALPGSGERAGILLGRTWGEPSGKQSCPTTCATQSGAGSKDGGVEQGASPKSRAAEESAPMLPTSTVKPSGPTTCTAQSGARPKDYEADREARHGSRTTIDPELMASVSRFANGIRNQAASRCQDAAGEHARSHDTLDPDARRPDRTEQIGATSDLRRRSWHQGSGAHARGHDAAGEHALNHDMLDPYARRPDRTEQTSDLRRRPWHQSPGAHARGHDAAGEHALNHDTLDPYARRPDRTEQIGATSDPRCMRTCTQPRHARSICPAIGAMSDPQRRPGHQSQEETART